MLLICLLICFCVLKDRNIVLSKALDILESLGSTNLPPLWDLSLPCALQALFAPCNSYANLQTWLEALEVREITMETKNGLLKWEMAIL